MSLIQRSDGSWRQETPPETAKRAGKGCLKMAIGYIVFISLLFLAAATKFKADILPVIGIVVVITIIIAIAKPARGPRKNASPDIQAIQTQEKARTISTWVPVGLIIALMLLLHFSGAF